MPRPLGPHLRLHPTVRRAGAATAAAALGAATLPAVAMAQVAGGGLDGSDSPGAGGAALDQIAIATTAATLFTILLLWLGFGHRSGKVGFLAYMARFSQRVSGLPGWAALPAGIAGVSLFVAVFGMYWDIALHIGVGRDEGPLANPAHYFILFGLFGIFTAGFVGIVLPKGPPVSASAIRIADDWYAPLGAVLVCACGAFALIGFPLDDVWHRIFGQDVTLWGPTHLMLIGGASMTLVGMAVLTTEAARANAKKGIAPPPALMQKARDIGSAGGLLIGLSTFQAEFDFGVPQFRFVLEPVMLMLATGIGLTAIRVWGGRGVALGAVLFFLAVRGFLTVTVGPILGEPMPTAPLYLIEAIIVELVALRIATTRPIPFALVCGVALGTIGLAAEWGWSRLAMPMPMGAALLPEAVPFALVAAVSGALVGTWMGTRMQVQATPSNRAMRRGALVGALGIALVIGLGLPKPNREGITATVALTDVAPVPGSDADGGRAVQAAITLSPPNAADDAKWLTVTSWQGNGFIVDHLERTGEGQYRTTQPIPVHGNWKSLLRLHVGRSLGAVPLYMPADSAIGAPETPALPTFTRTFVADHTLLQREQKPAAAGLTVGAYLTVVVIALALLALLVWGLHRLGVAGRGPDGGQERADGPGERAAGGTPPRPSATTAGHPVA